jgi:hypothetical protein
MFCLFVFVFAWPTWVYYANKELLLLLKLSGNGGKLGIDKLQQRSVSIVLWCINRRSWGRRGRDRMVVGLTIIYMQSVSITTDVVSSYLDQGEVYNII